MVRLTLTRFVKQTNCTVTFLDLSGHRVGASKDTNPSDSLTQSAVLVVAVFYAADSELPVVCYHRSGLCDQPWHQR